MITRFLVTVLFGALSCAAVADNDAASDGFSAALEGGLLMAANPRKGRRDGRQGDRHENRDGKQDCRQEEGRVGDDKRDCKQEERGDDDDDDNDDVEADKTADA